MMMQQKEFIQMNKVNKKKVLIMKIILNNNQELHKILIKECSLLNKLLIKAWSIYQNNKRKFIDKINLIQKFKSMMADVRLTI